MNTLQILQNADESRVSAKLIEWAERRLGITLVRCENGELHDEDDTWTCERCKCHFHDDEAGGEIRVGESRRANERWCDDCATNHATECADCSTVCSEDCYGTGRDQRGDMVCPCCADNYFTCDNCDNVFHNDYYGANGCCDMCSSSSDDDDVPAYHGSPKPWAQGCGSGLLFGCELEILAKSDRSTVYDLATNAGLFGERDGSLNDERGIEIIGKPMSLREHQCADGPWLSFLRAVQGKASGWDAGTGYGLHVSINRTPLSALYQGKLLVFVHQNKILCEKVAGRTENQWAKYHAKKLTSGKIAEGEKYEALAVRSKHRLEMRIFRSTLKEGFLRAVEFAAACVEFTRNVSPSELLADRFNDWLKGQRKTFPNLAAHLIGPPKAKPANIATVS